MNVPVRDPRLVQVLAIYPSGIRRRILRHLYLAPMQTCYIFSDCKEKFLDSLLAAARVELYMPQVTDGSCGVESCMSNP